MKSRASSDRPVWSTSMEWELLSRLLRVPEMNGLPIGACKD